MLTRKQKNNILCVIMAAILAVSAVGCSFVNVKEKETEGTETKSPEVTETKEVETEEPKETEGPAETEEPAETRDLTSKEFSDELMQFYLEAGEVYALFTKHASFDETEDVIYVNGAKYMAVDINGYTTIAELRDLCLQYFDEGLTRELISKIEQENDPLYIEKDEKLYRSIGYSAQDQIDWYDLYLYIESTENGKVNFFADFELPNAEMTTTAVAPCTFILTDDGEIRFTAFSLMDEVIENGIENRKITTISHPQPDPSKGEILVKVGSYGDLIYYGQDWIGMEGRPSGDATVGRVGAGDETGVGYITYGLGTYVDGKVEFSSYRTYRLESLNGYFIGFGSEDTVIRSEVLQYGTPYQGSLDGTHICEAASSWNGMLTYYKIEISGNEIKILYGPSHTDAGSWNVGEYTYDPKTGDFKAVVTHQNDNSESIDQSIGLQREFSGKIYLYKGFVHFIKDGDDIPENSLPLTFKPQIIITDLADWDKLPWVSEPSGDRKRAANAYNFIYNLVSGKSDVPEYNGLGIKDYSIELLEDLTFGEHTLRFTFTVTGNSLPETLPPGTYTKIIEDGMGLSVFDCDDVPVSLEESYKALRNDQYGMDQFGGNAAAEAVHTFLRWPSYANWYISPFGEWENDPFYDDEWAYQNYYYPYNYICGMYGDRSLSVEFAEMQRLLLEKFGIEVERPENGEWLSHCEYDAESDTVRYADTRGYRAVHRILDVTERDGVTDVTVQFYKDDHYLLPDFKVVYHIGEGEVFLGCEVIDAAIQENTAS